MISMLLIVGWLLSIILSALTTGGEGLHVGRGAAGACDLHGNIMELEIEEDIEAPRR